MNAPAHRILAGMVPGRESPGPGLTVRLHRLEVQVRGRIVPGFRGIFLGEGLIDHGRRGHGPSKSSSQLETSNRRSVRGPIRVRSKIASRIRMAARGIGRPEPYSGTLRGGCRRAGGTGAALRGPARRRPGRRSTATLQAGIRFALEQRVVRRVAEGGPGHTRPAAVTSGESGTKGASRSIPAAPGSGDMRRAGAHAHRPTRRASLELIDPGSLPGEELVPARDLEQAVGEGSVRSRSVIDWIRSRTDGSEGAESFRPELDQDLDGLGEFPLRASLFEPLFSSLFGGSLDRLTIPSARGPTGTATW